MHNCQCINTLEIRNKFVIFLFRFRFLLAATLAALSSRAAKLPALQPRMQRPVSLVRSRRVGGSWWLEQYESNASLDNVAQGGMVPDSRWS